MTKGKVIYIEADDRDTVRTHEFTGIVSIGAEAVVLMTPDGPRTHIMSQYVDFGIFPYGTANCNGGAQ